MSFVTSPAVRRLALFGAFFVLGVVLTWPVPLCPTRTVPVGTEAWPTVTLFNLWTVAWNADRLTHGLQEYWHAPIFHPAHDAFVYSEAQPTTLMVAPLVTWCGLPLAYNMYVWLILALNGWSACRLLRCWGCGRVAASAGGAMLQTLPYVHQQMGVVQLTTAFGFLWTLHAITLCLRGSAWVAGWRLGAAVAVTYLACNYHGYYLTIVAPLAFVGICLGPLILNRRRQGPPGPPGSANSAAENDSAVLDDVDVDAVYDVVAAPADVDGICPLTLVAQMPALVNSGQPLAAPAPNDQQVFQIASRFLRTGLVAAGIVAVLCGPVVWRQLQTFTGDGHIRSLESLRQLAANPADYLTEERPLLPWVNRCFPQTWRRSAWAASPGGPRWGLALLGFIAALMTGPRRAPWVTLVAIGCLAFWISLGPGRSVGGFSIYTWLYEHWPGCAQMRSPFRWMIVVQLAVTLLAARGLDCVSPQAGSRHRRSRTVTAISLGLAGCFGSRIFFPNAVVQIPTTPAWVQFLAEHSDPEDLAANLPFPQTGHIDQYQQTAWAMYWQHQHHRPLVNGYSGFFPAHYTALQRPLLVPRPAQLTTTPGDPPSHATEVPHGPVEPLPGTPISAPITAAHLDVLRAAGVRWVIAHSDPGHFPGSHTVLFDDPAGVWLVRLEPPTPHQ